MWEFRCGPVYAQIARFAEHRQQPGGGVQLIAFGLK
jgi:hypothetical protein